MKVILIGPADTRARLRAQLNGAVSVAGEFPTLAAAQASDVDADGMLFSPPPAAADDEDAPLEALTRRETQVLELLAEGLPNRGIADRLGIAEQTVKFHVAAILGKLVAANRTDAVRRAVRHGLIAL